MATLNLNQIKAQKKQLNWENIEKSGVISKAKIAIAKHPAKKKVILGAKGTGKSIIPMVKSLIMFEQDDYFNSFGFRKYKDQATSKMSTLFYQSYSLLRLYDFSFRHDYELKSNRAAVFRMDNKRNMLKNQAFQFGSLDNASGTTDGGAPSNGGYYGIISVDEPVIEADAADPTKIPTREDWDKDQAIIFDNLDRFNDNFEDVMDREVKTEIYYTMNNWGNHPLIQDTEEALPEDEFVEWIFGMTLDELFDLHEDEVVELFKNKDFVNRLKMNNTQSRYVKKQDTLYSRMTKFANPNNWKEKRLKPLLQSIANAIIRGDKQQLTILIGTKTIPEIDKEMLVYNVDDYNLAPIDKFKDYGVKSIHYAVDIDTSRVFTITPTILFEKSELQINLDMETIRKYDRKIFLDRQIEIPAYGTGATGELNDLYVKQITSAIKKHHKDGKYKVKSTISVDDKRKWYLNEIYKIRPDFLKGFRTFEQHGQYAIEERQDLFVLGLENKSLWIHEKNVLLTEDMNVCVKRDINDSRRKTTGVTNYLDRIDSSEQGVIEFASTIWKAGKPAERG